MMFKMMMFKMMMFNMMMFKMMMFNNQHDVGQALLDECSKRGLKLSTLQLKVCLCPSSTRWMVMGVSWCQS